MAKIMLIDATHPEETRVAVADGRKLEEFDVEIAGRRPLKGNIYLAKVTRVEPSLQAAFVEYGGNRHGFLAFSEIHPDYYRIPIADREALLRSAREDDEDEIQEAIPSLADSGRAGTDGRRDAPPPSAGALPSDAGTGNGQENDPSAHSAVSLEETNGGQDTQSDALEPTFQPNVPDPEEPRAESEMVAPWEEPGGAMALATPRTELRGERLAASDQAPETAENDEEAVVETEFEDSADQTLTGAEAIATGKADLMEPEGPGLVEVPVPDEVVEIVGGEEPAQQDDPELDEERARRRRQRNLRRYKIQEVIKRRQIILVQVTKEERGNKGAALTTYLSLAGRYCVLMPNTDRGGGISRRITNANDRKRLKSIIDDLDVPEGMAVIVRTAGMERSRSEISRDFEYLLRLWDEIRETTLQSTAPALIYEEASLIKRSIRDLYSRDISEIVVAGSDAYRSARAFMRTLTPSHLKRIQLYRDSSVPLFQRYQIEGQIAAIHEPIVQLRSGGYIVINQTEALVAIDVNSGRSTRERNIEETATRTNVEAADEIARQLRLRDLAGLIVIDFIDMEENRNNSMVERRLKEALKNDRARIQIGRISSFGLLEMSRQRLHPSLVEASTEICQHCAGTGRVRSVDSTSLHVLRMVEEETTRQYSPGVTVSVPPAVALYILNQKRVALSEIEGRRGVRIYVEADETLTPPDYRVERIKQLSPGEEVAARPTQTAQADETVEEEILAEEELDRAEIESVPEETEEAAASEAASRESDGQRGRKRRRRRGRSGKFRADEFTEADRQEIVPEKADVPTHLAARGTESSEPVSAEPGEDEEFEPSVSAEESGSDSAAASQEQRRKRRRGRRGGRRRQRRPQSEAAVEAAAGNSEHPEAPIPGLGDQPAIPDDLTRDWQSLNGDIEEFQKAEAVSTNADRQSAAYDPAADTQGPRQRRARRPRRGEENNDQGAVIIRSSPPDIVAAESEPAPREMAGSVSQPKIDRPVQVIEIRDSDEQPSSVLSEAADLREKKRGWWRRLME